jgi:glycosyltransferase involved in cell wall biosynthesis
MVQNLAQRGYQLARRSPVVRRLCRQPWAARLKLLAAAFLLGDPAYQQWLAQHLDIRRGRYRATAPAGLLSFVTTCWNTPVAYLRVMAESLLGQAEQHPFQWVVLDNGSTRRATRRYLDEVVAQHPQVTFLRAPHNLGIAAGMRLCLERATGRYVLPVDSDDYVYPDCVAVLASALEEHDFPALLYSDEDHLLGTKAVLPYFKPAWDPVLLMNSPYVAHLCAFDRRLALELDVYGDPQANGCHDWDTCLRFMAAGHTPVHIDDVLYSWRIHARSMSGNNRAKSYVHESQRYALGRFLASQPHAERYYVDRSPLFDGTPDWWIRRRHVDPRPLCQVIICDQSPAAERRSPPCVYPGQRTVELPHASGMKGLLKLLEQIEANHGLVCLVSDRVEIEGDEWPWECQTLLELHPDVAVVGGRIRNRGGKIVEAGRCLGFDDGCGCPDAGRSIHDPGYFDQMWKPHSVSAVSSQFAVFEAGFLRGLLAHCGQRDVPLALLGEWAGAYALRTGRRIVYSPFLSGVSDANWEAHVTATDRAAFLDANRDLLPDHRYYSRRLSFALATAYRPRPLGDDAQKAA